MSQHAVKQRDQALSWAPPATPVLVEGDGARLIQVVDNLLRNASQYTDAGGEIVISLLAAATPAESGTAILRVRDNGIGIPESMLDQVFELFSQVTPSFAQSRGGLGIGLSLVRALVQMHGGTVTAHSEGPGRGSEFVVKLPLREFQSASRSDLPDEVKPAGTTGRTPLRLLIVDDNADSVDALGMWLRIEGHEVEIAYTGEQALIVALARHPDAIVLDLALPGLNGYDVARRLRGEPGFERVCFIAMTGFGTYADRERARQAGFDHHLVKPIDYEVFSKLLSDVKAGRNPTSSVIRMPLTAAG